MILPMVIRFNLLNCQVCVPKQYTDEEVEAFVNKDMPTGIGSEWKIHRTEPVRVACEQDFDNVHIVLVC